MSNYFRIEVKYKHNNKIKNNGTGYVFSHVMVENKLEPTPYVDDYNNKKIEHWFTKKGWEQVGKKIIDSYEKEGYLKEEYNLKLRQRKTKPSHVRFEDQLQIMIVKPIW